MTSRRMRLLAGLMRPIVRASLSRSSNVAWMRRSFDLSARLWFRSVPDARFEPADPRFPLGGLWVSADAAETAPVLLYFHGGGFLVGSPQTHRHVVARLCALSGVRALLPRYRLAPAFPLSAGLEDSIAAFNALLTQGHQPQDIVLGGDSAGGCLALLLLSHLCRKGTPPRGCFAWSPLCDLTFSGASIIENAKSDHFFPGERVHDLATMILGHSAPDDPAVSPLYADFPDCPPVFIQASTCEILRDDSVRMIARLQKGGAKAQLALWDDAPHVWHLFDGWFPEARAAISDTATFLRSLSRPPTDS